MKPDQKLAELRPGNVMCLICAKLKSTSVHFSYSPVVCCCLRINTALLLYSRLHFHSTLFICKHSSEHLIKWLSCKRFLKNEHVGVSCWVEEAFTVVRKHFVTTTQKTNGMTNTAGFKLVSKKKKKNSRNEAEWRVALLDNERSICVWF